MVTWPMTSCEPWKVKLVTQICLAQYLENSWRCYLATIANYTGYSVVRQYGRLSDSFSFLYFSESAARCVIIIICLLDYCYCSVVIKLVLTLYSMFRPSSIVFSYSAYLLSECLIKFSSVQFSYHLYVSAIRRSSSSRRDEHNIGQILYERRICSLRVLQCNENSTSSKAKTPTSRRSHNVFTSTAHTFRKYIPFKYIHITNIGRVVNRIQPWRPLHVSI